MILYYTFYYIFQGRNLDAGSTEDDVTVYIGTVPAEVNSLDEEALTITLPAENPGRQCFDANRTSDNPCVVVSLICNTLTVDRGHNLLKPYFFSQLPLTMCVTY